MAAPEEIAGKKAEEAPKGGGNQFREAWSEMTMGRRLLVMGAAALIMGGFLSLLLWINKPDYQVLYSGLAQSDASQVVAKLKEIKVPYQLEGDGTVIKVPQDQVYETRLSMASAGLPRGQGIGFEVFNEIKITSGPCKANWRGPSPAFRRWTTPGCTLSCPGSPFL